MSKQQYGADGSERRSEPVMDLPNGVPEAGSDDRASAARVGMKRSDMARLATIAAENGITRNDLVAYALRHFIRRYDAGKLRVVKGAGPANE